jgi:hypothetical protein
MVAGQQGFKEPKPVKLASVRRSVLASTAVLSIKLLLKIKPNPVLDIWNFRSR